MVHNKSWKKAGIITLGIFMLTGLLAFLLYQNRRKFYPKVEEVTYLKVQLKKGAADLLAGVRIQNRAPFAFLIDSVQYQIRNNGSVLGYGNLDVGQKLPGLKDKLFDFPLFLNTRRYRDHLAQQKGNDSLDLEVQMRVYINPPLLDQQKFTINRIITTAIPKAPALQIDTFFVKSFSPKEGYAFQLNLNAENTNLPNLEIKDLNYSIRLTDSILINGKIDSTFRINKGARIVPVPIKVETAEMIELIRLKLADKSNWPYDAKINGIVKTDHALFENTSVTIGRSGSIDTRKFTSGSETMPSVKHILTMQLVPENKNTYLKADLLVHNPTRLPLYVDSARYFVRHKGKIIASGASDPEKVLAAKGDQSLDLQLAVNNQQYKQIMAQPQENNEIPLEVDLLLLYNLKNNEKQYISVKKKINVPVTKSPSFDVVDIGIKHLDPEEGAQLFVKLKIQNHGQTQLRIDDLKYRLLVKNDIDITGQTQQPININSGITEVDIPVDLSGEDINKLAKGLMQGIETWDYAFTGSASVSTPHSLLHNTEVTLQKNGVYEIKSKGTPDFMPEISKVDTLNVTIHYDTAWVHMYAAIYNTLPATIHVSKLQVDIIHKNDTIGKSTEKLDLYLKPNANSFAWHSLGVYYGVWEDHVKTYQNQDSMQLHFPARLFFDIGNLGKKHVDLDLETQIPTPGSPVTLLQRLKLRGFGFRMGLNFDALVAVQNKNSEGLTIKNIDYQIELENGVDICGKVNRTYHIPVGVSEVKFPVNLSVWEALQMLTRQLFGPPLIDYKIKATANARTDNPKLSDVYIIFENWNQSDMKEEKEIGGKSL